jgi:hypothetical protein
VHHHLARLDEEERVGGVAHLRGWTRTQVEEETEVMAERR